MLFSIETMRHNNLGSLKISDPRKRPTKWKKSFNAPAFRFMKRQINNENAEVKQTKKKNQINIVHSGEKLKLLNSIIWSERPALVVGRWFFKKISIFFDLRSGKKWKRKEKILKYTMPGGCFSLQMKSIIKTSKDPHSRIKFNEKIF